MSSSALSSCPPSTSNFPFSANHRNFDLPSSQFNGHLATFGNGNFQHIQSGGHMVNNHNNPFLMRSIPSLFNPMLIMNLIRSGNLGAFSGLLSSSQPNWTHTAKSETLANVPQMTKEETNDTNKNQAFSSSDEHSNDSISAELEENEESQMYDLYKLDKEKISDTEDLDQEEDSLGKFKSERSPMEMFPRLKSESSSDDEISEHRPRNFDTSRTSGAESNAENYCSSSSSNIYSSSSPGAFSSSSSSSSSSCTRFNDQFRKHSSPKLPIHTLPTTSFRRTNEKKINFAVISTLVD